MLPIDRWWLSTSFAGGRKVGRQNGSSSSRCSVGSWGGCANFTAAFKIANPQLSFCRPVAFTKQLSHHPAPPPHLLVLLRGGGERFVMKSIWQHQQSTAETDMAVRIILCLLSNVWKIEVGCRVEWGVVGLRVIDWKIEIIVQMHFVFCVLLPI